MIYADANSTTPVHPSVVQAMHHTLQFEWGNPSSSHQAGKRSRATVEKSRSHVRDWLNAANHDIIFTSGGTEANNLAITSALAAHPGRHIVTSELEHPSVALVINNARALGYKVAYAKTLPSGEVDEDHLAALIKPGQTALVSLMWANNETGVIQPVKRACELAQAAGALFHTDAVQVAGKLPVSLKECPADYLSLSAHKFGGPKGVGALVVSRAPSQYRGIRPLLVGGGQEQGFRSGTENVPGIVGLGEAAALLIDKAHPSDALARDYFEAGMSRIYPQIRFLGKEAQRVYNTSLLRLSGVNASKLVRKLDAFGVAVSTGSACHSGSLAPSSTLTAMGLNPKEATEVIRVSLLSNATISDISSLLHFFAEVLDSGNHPAHCRSVAA